ncbi:carboxypeptidase-like regulatory domain-containing protein [Dyella choica]|uniref:Carboxypeptidase regulatory-like domain-containing protein n=1 Tax=Dyella choica TaxID=1927959 RepID=A0A432M958_9GAMM|nr:carboxypeptidase-like regulatory domain-containing protein [Dyella choica]RUL77508.1 carboxypeptidase regulatory-like domain-containing protein [Dyella choica]
MSKLIIPIDASQISEKDREKKRLRVAVRAGRETTSEVVVIESGKGQVSLEVDAKQSLLVAVGPESASEEDLFHLRTININVSPRQWDGNSLTLAPIAITPIYWRWWWIWCREFTITGQVLCADGSPVPGAQVSAFDVDYWWWWSSISQVGKTVVTDASGHFTLSFRWCCGWWPWWWWESRYWRLDPVLVEKLHPILKLHPELDVRDPSAALTLDLIAMKPQASHSTSGVLAKPTIAASRALSPELITQSRGKLLASLPYIEDFERLRIWPWFDWYPWLDCSPDIIFKVTQNCGGAQDVVIVDENILQTRWDIPTDLNVTLTANQNACCIRTTPPPPEGHCVLMTEVCQIPVTEIGGNAGTTGPVGFAYPNDRDRPFAETIVLYGQFGTTAQADYYSIQYSPHSANTWNPVPPTAVQGFSRLYYDATLAWPTGWQSALFPAVGGVYESRQHYEATHPGPAWGAPSGRSWIGDADALASITTKDYFADGAYDFQVVAYKGAAGGGPDLTTAQVLPGCGEGQNNTGNVVTVWLDNRIASFPPGTVHVNTTEPDCGVTAVRLGGTTVLPCSSQVLQPGTPLEIDFFVTDPDGHLDDYSIVLKYGLNSEKNLLSAADVGSFSYIAGPGVSVGPDYSQAVTPSINPPQSAIRPIWNGGNITLHIDDASKVFPETCCYLIELTAWKRNIVNCEVDTLTYYNQSHYSFTITV